MKLNAKKMGTMKALKDSLKKGGSGGSMNYIKNVPADGITVRFLTEPEEWFGYMEYWDSDAKTFVPMTEGEILPDGAKPSFRYLANAVDVETDRVIPLKLSKTAANSLILKYDKYDTIVDRPYELQKHGEGLDTTYDVTPDAPSKMNMAKYEPLDLELILIAARAQATGETIDSTVNEKPAKSKEKSAPVAEDESLSTPDWDYGDFTYEELFPDDQIRIDYVKQELEVMSPDDQSVIAEFWEKELGELLEDGFSSAILELQRENAQVSDEDEDEEEEESDDDDDDDEETEISEEELNAMPISAIRSIAKSLDVETKGLSKEDLIEAIIDASEA